MPCNSDYMNPTQRELNASRVCCLHDELNGKPWDQQHWDGYHPLAYNADYNLDEGTAVLCARLKTVDVTKYSLELQMWWRDHQRADAEREAREKADADARALAKSALGKLTPEERQALKKLTRS